MNLHEPKYPTAVLAEVLEVPAKYLHNRIRNASSEADRIPATIGEGTRDQLWSAFDAARLWLVYQFEGAGAGSPRTRKNLFDDLDVPDRFEAALRGKSTWIVLAPFDQAPRFLARIDPSLWDPNPWIGSGPGDPPNRIRGAARMYPLHATLKQFVDELEREAAGR